MTPASVPGGPWQGSTSWVMVEVPGGGKLLTLWWLESREREEGQGLRILFEATSQRPNLFPQIPTSQVFCDF